MAQTDASYEGVGYDSLLQRDGENALNYTLGGNVAIETGNSNNNTPSTSSVATAPASSSPSTSNGSVEVAAVKSSGALHDVWIDSWIKSISYRPKSQGFFIDGGTGYAEFTDVFVSGEIEALTGHIGGTIIGQDFISSDPYASGVFGTGWSINKNGTAEFQDVTIRGKISSASFEKNSVSAVNGMFLITKTDVLDAPMSSLDSATVVISGSTTFVNNEVLRIKLDISNDEWMLVTDASNAPIYVVARDIKGDYAPNNKPAWTKGSTVVSMGVGSGTKTGFLMMDSTSSNSPYLDIYGRTGTNWYEYGVGSSGPSTPGLPNVRLGWLKGIVDTAVGLNNHDIWGLYSNSVFLRGYIGATSGFFGDPLNGIGVNANGITIIGSGTIKTNSSSYPRITITSDALGVGLGRHALYATNSAGEIAMTLSAESGTAYSAPAYAEFNIASGAMHGIEILTSGSSVAANGIKVYLNDASASMAGKAGLNILNNSTHANGAILSSGPSAVKSLVSLTGNSQNGVNIAEFQFALTPSGSGASGQISNEGYLQFPSYYHSSDFDEYVAAATDVSSTVIAKAYWRGTLVGTGTQKLVPGTNEDVNTYVKLSTGATGGGSSSAMAFARGFGSTSNMSMEIRFKFSSLTNFDTKIGFSNGTSELVFLNYSSNPTTWSMKSYNGASTQYTNTLFAQDTSWHTFRLTLYDSTHCKAWFDHLPVTGTVPYLYIPSVNGMKPYIYIGNLAAEEKILYVDYIRIWAGRDMFSAVS